MRNARLARPASEARPQYDAVVVGSGYGGGVAASRLARCGLKVAVLERGREFLPGEYPQTLLDAQKHTQVTVAGRRIGPADGLFDIRLGRDVHVLTGCGVGGTSLINANVCLAPDLSVMEDERWPDPVRRDHYLNIGFHRAREMLSPLPLPDREEPLKLKALGVAARGIGREVERVPLHIAFAAGVNAAGVRQEACTSCGDCMGGCNVGAKTTVHSTYLADAVNHGAEIIEGTQVRFIERAGTGLWRVAFRTSEEGADRIVSRQSVLAGIVVLAAGTLGSNEILMRSAGRGLRFSERLGKNVSTNGDAICIGYDNKQVTNAIGIGTSGQSRLPPPGPAVTGLIDLRRRRQPAQRLAIVEAAVQSSMARLLSLVLPATTAFAPAKDPIKSVTDLLADARSAGASIAGGAYTGAASKTQFFLAVGHDSGGGEITLQGDDVAIHWPNALSEPVFKAIDETIAGLVKTTGGTYIPNPVSSRLLGGNLFTVHPLGGCSMAADRTRGVVDHKCRVFDGDPGRPGDGVHEGLYVCDASVLPCSLGVHPLLTITAVAERAMLLLARDRGLKLDTAPKADAPERVLMAATQARRRGWFGRG